MRYLVLCLAVCLSACTLPKEPEMPPPPAVTQGDLDVIRSELRLLHQDVATLSTRLDTHDMVWTRLERVESLLSKPEPRKKGQTKGAGREPSPLQLVSYAQKEARVQPSERGYFGKSAEQTYTWQPGRLYTVYLKQNQATLIALPPGEQLVIGLALVESDFTVLVKRAGNELLAYDTISIAPTIDKGETDGAVLTQSGRRYLFHFVIGTVGMNVITFETPAIGRSEPQEPKLILPKPQS